MRQLKKELLSKKEPELGYLENLQPDHIAKNEKTCSEENIKDVAKQPFDKEMMDVTHGFNQPFQQRLGIEMELYQQRCSIANLNESREKAGWNEERLSDFLDTT